MNDSKRLLLTGDEAVALAARDVGVALGTGYPGTPSTEILECFSKLGGKAQWAPNEKVALEVALGVAFAGARAIATMKHVGLNVAADPLFTAAYTDVRGALVVVSADDPGMASSQNEQDNRRYAVAAAVPMLEPADAQEAYDFTVAAVAISERWRLPVLLRMTTRCCHSKSIVVPRTLPAPALPKFERDINARVMIPANARGAHFRLRKKLAEMAKWNEQSEVNRAVAGDAALGIIVSGAAYLHAREAAPTASFLKLGFTYPLPLAMIRAFAASVRRCLVIEEGDPYLADALRAAGVAVEAKPEMYRFGELNVTRVRRILAGDTTPEPAPVPGKPPQLCNGCAHGDAFATLRQLDCIVAGDIGCYTLGVLPPFEAMDTLVCMGAGIGVGLGLRHSLPPEEARRVVSVIGDSTFVHSGITGLVEMVYNPPPTGHVVLILDNSTTAMTGHQEHPGTGRTMEHEPTGKVSFEGLARSLGIANVHVVDPCVPGALEQRLRSSLANGQGNVIIARRPCLLVAGKIRGYERARIVPKPAPRGRSNSHEIRHHQHRHRGPRRPGRDQGVRHCWGRGFSCGLRREKKRAARHEPARRFGLERRPVRPRGVQSDGAHGGGRFSRGGGRRPGGREPPSIAPRWRVARARHDRSGQTGEPEKPECGAARCVEPASRDCGNALARRDPRGLPRETARGEPAGVRPGARRGAALSGRSGEIRLVTGGYEGRFGSSQFALVGAQTNCALRNTHPE